LMDPAKHPEEFLQDFITQQQAGTLPTEAPAIAPDTSDVETLSDAFKAMQKRHRNFKNLWSAYCERLGGRKMDPKVHTTDFLLTFVESLADQAAGGGGGGVAPAMRVMSVPGGMSVPRSVPMPTMAMTPTKTMIVPGVSMAAATAPPAKMMRTTTGAGVATSMGAPVSTKKANLVERVKSFQRGSTEQKEFWVEYATTYLGGVLDPNRHDEFTLEEFCTNHDVPEAETPASTPRAPAAAGGGAGAAAKNVLVERIKQFGRSGQENKELWTGYCTQFLGGKFDPAKHDASILSEFCSNHGVPELEGSGAATGGPIMPAAAGGAGGAAGAAQKANLVERVKAFQRASPEQKEFWCEYANTYLGGTLDPAKHILDDLTQFCENHGVPEVETPPTPKPGLGMTAPRMGGMAKVGLGMAAKPGMGAVGGAPAALVERVKAFQKSGGAQAWLEFCGKTKDPAKHDAAKLTEFCNLHGC